MRHAYHDLAGVDDLSGIGQRLHDYAVGISEQNRVASCIACHIGLGFRCVELCPGRFRRGLDLVIGRCRYGAGPDQVAIPGLVLRGLPGPCPRRDDCLLLCVRRQLQVVRVDAHERLAALDGLAGIDQTLQHFARDTKAQVALDPGGNGSRE
ncbi:hypothetical protein D9M69_149220 [compost metagenome]